MCLINREYLKNLVNIDQNAYQLPLETKKGLAKKSANPYPVYGAEGGNRTRTGIHPLSPEPSASTNSATSAQKFLDILCKKTYPYAQYLSTIYVTEFLELRRLRRNVFRQDEQD